MSIALNDEGVPTVSIGDGDVLIGTFPVGRSAVVMFFAPLPAEMLPPGADRVEAPTPLEPAKKFDPPKDTAVHLNFFTRASLEAVIKDMTAAMNKVWPV